MIKKIKNKSGLTLLELLIVLTIILILWILMAQRFSGRIYVTKKATCKANIRIIQTQLEIYEAKFGRYPLSTPSEFQRFLANKKFFVEKPVCPFNDPSKKIYFPYIIDTKTGLVNKHRH